MKAKANILEHMLTFQTAVSQKECFCGCCKRHGQSSSGRQDFIWLPGPRHSPSRREVRAGPWRQKLTQRIWRVLLLACFPGHAPPAFLYNPGHLSRNGPHQSSTMKMPQEAFPQAILMEEFFSTHVPFSQMTQCVSSWPKANQHRCDLTTLAPITMFNYPHYDEQRFRSSVTLNSSLLQKQLFRAGV